MIDFIDKTTEQNGTPINRANLMAIQGFQAQTTVFNVNNGRVVSIVQTNSANQTLTTVFNSDGSITETFVGDKTISKKTTFNSDKSITEVLL